MDLSVMNTELLQKNFKQMSHEMRRHLAMHLSFFHSSEKSDTLSDPLFQLSTDDLKLFYELNKYLYPVDVQNRLAITTRTNIRRALYLLGQDLEPHILRVVDTVTIQQEMDAVIGQEAAKRTLLDLIRKTNRTHKPFRVLLVGTSGVGKSMLSDLVAQHYHSRRIDCGSINTSVFFAGAEASYSDSNFGALVEAALDQEDCLQLTALDQMSPSDKNGSPFPALTQFLSDHTVSDLYLGVPVHANAIVIAEAATTEGLPADMLSAFDAVVTLEPPTREEQLTFGCRRFEQLAQGQMELAPETLPFLLDNYCPDEGMKLLGSVLDRLVNAALSAPEPPAVISCAEAQALLGPMKPDEYEQNILCFRQHQYPAVMQLVGLELMRYVSANRNKNTESARTECDKARKRFSYIARLHTEEQPLHFDLKAFDRDTQQIVGLAPVKERLRALLAGMEASNASGRPILFVGPAGTGKTQLCRVFAQALSIPFEKISCAGVDSDGFKGSSALYNNSKAGLIAEALKRAGTTRTVLLLDEADKCQPAAQAALLDLLDGHRSYFEQYLRCDIDVRQTVFVLTANDLSLLSPILRDRCEIIAMKGYTWEEKLEIARQVMLPAALNKYGMPSDALPDPLVKDLIRQYCRAPGCRDLEGGLLRLCEAWLLRRVEGNNNAADPALLKTLFGSPLELPDDYPAAAPENTVGIVRTLAVAQNAAGTSLGVSGAVQVLLTARPGITITGHAEEGLRESVLTALAAAENTAGKALPDGHGVHVHFCGDSSKDGASAGVAIALAIMSLLLSQPVPRTAAFTGTIDLLGCIGRVGGIREKCEASLAAGCTQVFLPAGNRDDLPQELKELAEAQGAEILFADTFGQVLEKALCQTAVKAR